MVIRLIGIIISVVIAFLEPAIAQAQLVYTGRVLSDRVAVRAGQHVNFETLLVVNKGDELVVTGSSYGWLKVKLPAAVKTYVKAEHVMVLAPDLGEVKPEKLNVRSAPTTDATVLGKVVRGQKLSILENKGEWLVVRPVDELTGWVKEGLVEPTKKPVPARLYAEPVAFKPAVTVAPARAEENLLRKIDGNKVEAVGVLEKGTDPVLYYRIVRGGKTVCVIDGPASLVEAFVGAEVRMTGTTKPGSVGIPVVKLSRIQFNI
jgi:N-acetylmuramoyl-L-alanine amidase